jgi:hypothetical protein
MPTLRGTCFQQRRQACYRLGRDSHPLDAKRSFMVVSHLPVPFDPQGLVALFSYSLLGLPCPIPNVRSLK